MESLLHVGNKDMHESSKDASEAIVRIFQGAREYSMDQSIVDKALETFMRVSEVKQVTVSGCTFTTSPNISVHPKKDAKDSEEPEITEEDDDLEDLDKDLE